MDRNRAIREWFGAVRRIADDIGRELDAPMPAKSVRAVKAAILFRHHLCDGLAPRIEEADGIPAARAKEMRDQAYSELIEDAIAGIYSEQENMEIVMFLDACMRREEDGNGFAALLAQVMPEDGESPEDAAKRLADRMDRELTRFAEKRRELRVGRDDHRDDGPPPWMDEFEYIDWIMTH